MKFRIVVLILMGLALNCEADATDTETTRELLGQLCAHKRSAPAVTRVSEVLSLARQLVDSRKYGLDCDENVALAIRCLRNVVELKNVCSQESADAIVNFWEVYIESKSSFKKHLPRQLKKFFVAYGMQVSKVCKKALIEQLEKATNERGVSETDFNLVTEDVRKRINIYIGDDWRIENLLLVIQRDRQGPKHQIYRIATVNMEPLHYELFQRIRERCMKKFKPVYFDLITPIVRLAAIGFKYKGKLMRAAMNSFEQKKIYKNWFAAIVSCEISLKITVISVPKLLRGSEGIKRITVLDEDDMRELESKGLAREEPQLEWSSYYTVNAEVNDLVLDSGDSDLIHSMRRFKSYLNEVTEFHLKMLKKAAKSAKETIDPALIQWGLRFDKGK